MLLQENHTNLGLEKKVISTDKILIWNLKIVINFQITLYIHSRDTLRNPFKHQLKN
jgi:hypothetical protein